MTRPRIPLSGGWPPRLTASKKSIRWAFPPSIPTASSMSPSASAAGSSPSSSVVAIRRSAGAGLQPRPACRRSAGVIARTAGVSTAGGQAGDDADRGHPTPLALTARPPKKRLLLERPEKLAALALSEAADGLSGAHVAALQEACCPHGPVSWQRHDHLEQLGRGEVGGWVSEKVGERAVSVLQIGLQQCPLDSCAVGLRERFLSLSQGALRDFTGQYRGARHGQQYIQAPWCCCESVIGVLSA